MTRTALLITLAATAALAGCNKQSHTIVAGGPPADEPGADGFGARFIRGAVEQELGGRVASEFSPHGLHCVITVPLPSAAA